ncbi:MAG: MFS transporter [Armatimonadota bacterium]
MNRNVATILIVSALFGLSFGVYDFVLPFYLSERGFSYARMANVFAISSASVVFVRVVMGKLSDAWGRKSFYSASLLGSAVASVLTPTAISVPALAGLKALREASALTRDTMHSVLLYAETRTGFLNIIGKSRGIEFLTQAGGTLAAGILLASLGSSRILIGAGLVSAVAFFIFTSMFREKPQEPSAAEENSAGIFSFDMSRNLKIITLAAAVSMLGISVSHCFIMPLFFARKFNAAPSAVGVVMTLHRLSLAFPLLIFSGWLSGFNLRRLYMASIACQGITTILAAAIPHFWAASIVWLLHDLIGAGVWVPIQSTLIQAYSRECARGLDVGKSLALSSLGGVAGPYLAGWLAPISISAPFLVSGIITMAAVPILLLLSIDSDDLPIGGQTRSHAAEAVATAPRSGR